MTMSRRHLVRMLTRLALPLVATLAVVWTPAPAKALTCLEGFHYEYFDAQGQLCALIDDCQHYHWQGCDMDLSYVTYTETTVLCAPCH